MHPNNYNSLGNTYVLSVILIALYFSVFVKQKKKKNTFTDVMPQFSDKNVPDKIQPYVSEQGWSTSRKIREKGPRVRPRVEFRPVQTINGVRLR